MKPSCNYPGIEGLMDGKEKLKKKLTLAYCAQHSTNDFSIRFYKCTSIAKEVKKINCWKMIDLISGK